MHLHYDETERQDAQRARDEDHWAMLYWIAQDPDVVRRILRKEPLAPRDSPADEAALSEVAFGMNDPYFLVTPPTLRDDPIPFPGGGLRR